MNFEHKTSSCIRSISKAIFLENYCLNLLKIAENYQIETTGFLVKW